MHIRGKLRIEISMTERFSEAIFCVLTKNTQSWIVGWVLKNHLKLLTFVSLNLPSFCLISRVFSAVKDK